MRETDEAAYYDFEALLSLIRNDTDVYSRLMVSLNSSHLLEYYDYDTSRLTTHSINVIVSVTFGAAFLLGIVGNCLVVYVVCRHGAMKTVTNLFFVNLAIADLLFLCTCIPFTALNYVMPQWPFGEFMCKLVNYLMVVSMTTSVMTLTAMGFDRYYAVVRPVKSRAYRTVGRTLTLLSCIWCIDIFTIIPVATISKTTTFWDLGELKTYCVAYFETDSRRQAYTLCLFIFFYLIPLSFIAVCYFLMAKNLWTSVRPGTIGDSTIRSTKARRKIAKMVLAVVTTFAICWFPIHCVHLITDFGPSEYAYSLYMTGIVAHVLSYINSAINPIIYSFMSKNFRECFRAAFCCKKVANGTVFIVVEPRQKKSSSNSNQKGSGTKTSSGPRSPTDKVTEKIQMRATALTLPVVEEDPCPAMAIGSVV